MRGRLSLICIGLLACNALRARTDRLLLELCVNDHCHGSAFVVLQNRHVFVDEEALRGANVHLPDAAGQDIGSTHFIDVSASDRVVQVRLDDSAGRLFLTLEAGAFENHRIDLNPRPEHIPSNSVASAFVNYSFDVGTGGGSGSTYLDAGFAYGQGLLRDNPSWSGSEGFSRGLTRFEYDDVDRTQRFTVGDQYAFSSDGLGGTALLGGVGVVSAFDLNPYLVTFPQPTISGLLQAPGTIEVYENGVLLAQREVPAGPFNLASLGLGAGANNVRVVVHDPFGGTTVLQQNIYGATQLLAQGLSDYAYEVGIERSSTQADGYQAGHGVLLLRDSYGFSDSFTAGYRVEAEKGVVNAGPHLSLGTPLGLLSAGAGASDAAGIAGYGTSFAYQYNGRTISFGSGIQVFSGAYRRIGDVLLPASSRPRRASSLNLRWTPMSRLSLQALAGSERYEDGSRQRNGGFNVMLNLPSGPVVAFGVNRQLDEPGGGDDQMFLSVVMPVGRGSVGVSDTRDRVGGDLYGVTAQRSVPSGDGWGYSINAQNGAQGETGIGQAQYQSRYGLAQLTVERLGGETSGNVLFSGSLVALDDHLYAGRALQNGYALIETPDVAGVKITRENQTIGETDVDGNLLVTNLLPYQANKIGIDQGSVSPQDEIDATAQVISVPRLGGTVVHFGVHALHAAHGVLTLEGKALQYGTATLMANGTPQKTLVGLDGSFYFADLPAGRYALRARTSQGEVSCPLSMPPGTQSVTDLGIIACSRGQDIPR